MNTFHVPGSPSGIACTPYFSTAPWWHRHNCLHMNCIPVPPCCLNSCHVPVSLHSGLGITCLYTWCVQGCHTVAWVLLFANLPCPGDTTQWTGLPVHMTAMFQSHHMTACTHLFTHLPYLSVATGWPGNVCLHTFRVTTTPCGSLGTPVYKFPVSQNHHLAAWAYLLAHLLFPSMAIWWHQNTCPSTTT